MPAHKTWLQRALDVAAGLGASPGESEEARGERAALLLVTFVMMIVSAIWSAIYAALGRPLTASIPGGYSLVTFASLIATALGMRIELYRVTQTLLILSLPFGVQASLGGFEGGSAVMIWAFLPVVGALVFDSRYAPRWLALYLVGIAIMGALESPLRARVEPLGDGARSVFWVGNLAGISILVFLVIRHFIDYVVAQRRVAQDALHTIERQAVELREARARLEHEVELARDVQLAMLPRQLTATGMELAARMSPATEVGGDYFDLLPGERGCWIAVGDVSGHGLTAGLVALMVQSIVATLVERDLAARPSGIVAALNRVLFENVHHRLLKEIFVTFCLLRFTSDGRIALAGAHEPLLVVRARTGRCDVVATPGAWLAVVPDISALVPETTIDLEPGDLLVLHTDGITEAMDAAGTPFGLDRLAQMLERAAGASVEQIRDAVLDAVCAWQPEAHDDRTLLVARYRGVVS